MKYTKQQAADAIGAQEAELHEFSGKSIDDINSILISMFGQDGNNPELAEELKIYAEE